MPAQPSGLASAHPPSIVAASRTTDATPAHDPSTNPARHDSPLPASAASAKRAPGCHRCRERHTKCSKERPVCSNCRRARCTSPCSYERKPSFRFRQSRYSSTRRAGSFPTEKARQQQDFVIANEVRPAADENGYTGQNQTSQVVQPTSPVYGIIVHRGAKAGCHETAPHRGRPDSQYGPLASSMHRDSPSSISPLEDAYASTPSPSDGSRSVAHGVAHAEASSSRILTDDLDCRVFDFYVRCVGHWLGIGSPNRYFQSRVPQLALSEPLLLFACLSCAAHIMSLVGEVERSVEEHYRGKVLELLIPLLSSPQATSSNEVLLATTIILRMSEQFEEADDDSHCHLNGAASLLTDGTDWSPTEDNLAVACFWTHLRESIRVCFLREQPCPIDLDQLSLGDDDMAYGPPGATEELWTNRMTYLLLRICNLCWGSSPEGSGPGFARLQAMLAAWRRNLPLSLQPWCIREAEGPFPRFQCLESWHVVAWQFYYTARVMLTVHRADEKRSTSLHVFRHYLEDDIIAPTRWLCGLCLSSTANVGNSLNGSHLMAWCGQFLPGREEQGALRDFLRTLGVRTGWPVEDSCRKLEEAWGGSRRSWDDC